MVYAAILFPLLIVTILFCILSTTILFCILITTILFSFVGLEREDGNQIKRASSSCLKLFCFSGAYETRTRDPMRDRHVF